MFLGDMRHGRETSEKIKSNVGDERQLETCKVHQRLSARIERLDFARKRIRCEINWLRSFPPTKNVLIILAMDNNMPIDALTVFCGPCAFKPRFEFSVRNKEHARAGTAPKCNVRTDVLFKEFLLMRMKCKPVIWMRIRVMLL